MVRRFIYSFFFHRQFLESFVRLNLDIVSGENMQLMSINSPSSIYINSDEALANINVTVTGTFT